MTDSYFISWDKELIMGVTDGSLCAILETNITSLSTILQLQKKEK